MNRLFAALLCLLALALPAIAADTASYEALTVAATAVGITETTFKPTGKAPMTACSARLETAQIRLRDDGTDPTAAVGMPVEVGDVITFATAADAARAKFIRTGATSGVLHVRCWR
jgi:hypothetical protein